MPSLLANRASYVVLTSPALRSQIDHERVAMVSAAADLTETRAPTARPTSRAVLHVGTINVFKLSPHFVPLHVQLAEQGGTVHVAGTGGDEQRFRDDAIEHRVAERFVWHGFVDDLRPLLTDAAVLSYPVAAFSYASSDKLIQESQACGLPVLLPRRAATAHLVRHGVTGWLAEDDDDFRRRLLAITHGECELPSPAEVRAAA
ncbi:MAG: glycosyltransferase [Planctomycetota bacterium]|nr:MAG: glycosyltransferase [Planctomycetota bacterium]REK17360.1 MAG: glycosyltransferase [Planctomycetota bacterium]REK46035.1 MAG: glycosyltransferase [Planctomycetota bacterium]